MSAFSDSRLITQGGVVQLSYELPHRIHTAATYPVRAPNGSTIILYGHSYGIKIIWRGGRSFRRDNAQAYGSTRADGKNASANSNADYESGEEDTESIGHFPPIVHDEDLCLGTGVLHISVPDFRCISRATVQATTPPIFIQKIVCATACEDHTIRTIAIPLEPPSLSLSSEASTWGEEIAVMGGVHGHQAIPNAISMTWTLRISEDDSNRARFGRNDVKSGGFPVIDLEKEECDLLIASHSPQVSGVILLAKVAIERVNGTTSTIDTSPIFPFQTVHLRGPARQIGFNPVPYPSPRHSHLLVAEIQGPTRVFDPFRSRHSSSSSAAVAASSQQARNSSKTFNQGSWLATFFPSFDIAQVLDDTASKRNRYILDAQWSCSGREIVGLFADGEWGVWDFDALMNGSSNALQQPQQQPQQRSKPVVPTHFAIRGYVGLNTPSSSSIENPSSRSTSNNNNNEGKYPRTLASSSSSSSSLLAPMTPNTRREKGGRVFSSLGGAEPSSNRNGNGNGSSNNNFKSIIHHSTLTSNLAPIIPQKGSISISRANKTTTNTSTSSNKNNNHNQGTHINTKHETSFDSTVLIHYAGHFYDIPSLRAFRLRCVTNEQNRKKNINHDDKNKNRHSGAGSGSSTGSGLGSLYAPSLTRLKGLQGLGGGGQQITSAQHLSLPTIEPSLPSLQNPAVTATTATMAAAGGGGGGGGGGGRGIGNAGINTLLLLITTEYTLIFCSDPALYVRSSGNSNNIGNVISNNMDMGMGVGVGNSKDSSANRSTRWPALLLPNSTSTSTIDIIDTIDTANTANTANTAAAAADVDRMDVDVDVDMDVDNVDTDKNMDKTVSQHLLSRGQLDLNGVSRLLDDMSDSHDANAGTMVNGRMSSSSVSPTPNVNKRVGFAA